MDRRGRGKKTKLAVMRGGGSSIKLRKKRTRGKNSWGGEKKKSKYDGPLRWSDSFHYLEPLQCGHQKNWSSWGWVGKLSGCQLKDERSKRQTRRAKGKRKAKRWANRKVRGVPGRGGKSVTLGAGQCAKLRGLAPCSRNTQGEKGRLNCLRLAKRCHLRVKRPGRQQLLLSSSTGSKGVGEYF